MVITKSLIWTVLHIPYLRGHLLCTQIINKQFNINISLCYWKSPFTNVWMQWISSFESQENVAILFEGTNTCVGFSNCQRMNIQQAHQFVCRRITLVQPLCFVCLVLLKPQSGLYAMFSSNTVANVVYSGVHMCWELWCGRHRRRVRSRFRGRIGGNNWEGQQLQVVASEQPVCPEEWSGGNSWEALAGGSEVFLFWATEWVKLI